MKLSSPIQIIKKSIEIFFEKKNMINFVKIYLPLVPVAILSIWMNNNKLNTTMNLLNIAYLLLYGSVSFWISISGIIAIKNVLNNESLNIKTIYKKAWSMIVGFMLLSILVFLIVFGGLILLIIPAVIFGIWYSFSSYVYLDNPESIKGALVKSKSLVKGRFWGILGRYIIFGLATMLFGIIVSIIPYGIGGIITTVFGALFVLPYYLLYLEVSESV